MLLYLYAVINVCLAKPKAMMNAQIACELLSTLATERTFAYTLGRVAENMLTIAINEIREVFERDCAHANLCSLKS